MKKIEANIKVIKSPSRYDSSPNELNIILISSYSEVMEGVGQQWKEILKKQGITDESIKRGKKKEIERFFRENYVSIVESQVTANSGDDFQADINLTQHMQVKTCIVTCPCIHFIDMV